MNSVEPKLLEILIPTFNREKELVKNLMRISAFIIDNHFEDLVGVLISDNGSSVSSFEYLESHLEATITCCYRVFRQESNIGIEKNVLFLLEQSRARYVMTLGDDDYFTEQFLVIAMEYLLSGQVRGIIPNYYCIDGEGKLIAGSLRDPIKKDIIYDEKSLWISEKGHQLSCIVFEREGVLEAYKGNVKSNVYPFVYFIAVNLKKGKMVHVTREPFANTVISHKNWDYSYDKLMGELAIVFDALPYSSSVDKNKQLFTMIKDNARRFCYKKTYLHPAKTFRRIDSYNVSDLVKRQLKIRFLINFAEIPLRRIKKRIKRLQK